MKPPRIRPFYRSNPQRVQIRFNSNLPPSQWHKCSTVELAYEFHNEGECRTDSSKCKSPIVFLHGLFGSKQNNRSISKRLSADLNRPIYAIDLRNHGASPHSTQHTYATLAADVSAFIDAHKLNKPTLIGHSMGAKTVMALALWQPSRIGNLIAVDNAPIDAALKSDFHSYVTGMREIAKAKVKKQTEADEILKPYAKVGEEWGSGIVWPTELAVRQFLMQNLVRPKGPASADDNYLRWRIPLDSLAKQLDAMGDFPFSDPDQARYEGPTLIVRGTKSPYVADEALPIIGRFFPKFRLVDVEAGHWLISENPEAFRQAVVEFLEDKD